MHCFFLELVEEPVLVLLFLIYLSLFVFYRTQVQSLHCLALSLSQSVLLLNFVQVGNPLPSVSTIEQPTDLKKDIENMCK